MLGIMWQTVALISSTRRIWIFMTVTSLRGRVRQFAAPLRRLAQLSVPCSELLLVSLTGRRPSVTWPTVLVSPWRHLFADFTGGPGGQMGGPLLHSRGVAAWRFLGVLAALATGVDAGR